MVVLSINSIGTFEVYKIWLIIIDDHIIKYNINYKRFLFGISLKLEIIDLIIKLVKKDTIDWKMIIIISQ